LLVEWVRVAWVTVQIARRLKNGDCREISPGQRVEEIMDIARWFAASLPPIAATELGRVWFRLAVDA
jgi:hypothetical protein